jgi:periplasmic copper chaperone A
VADLKRPYVISSVNLFNEAEMKHARFLLLATLLFSVIASAADIEVKSAWVRGTVPAQMMSGAFMEITSKNGATLLGVSTPAAEDAEVHEMRLEGGVMKMRAAPRLALPAGKAVTLKPGGYHIMLMGLKQQLKAGDVVPINLKIEGAKKKMETLTINAEVRDLTASSGPEHHHMH